MRIVRQAAVSMEHSGIMDLAEGQRVAVDVADGQKGPEAVSLRLI
jgi:cold shock CspA family protein